MRFLVWGCGAIGGTAAAYWSLAGVDVTVVDSNGEHVKAIQERGLRVYGPLGDKLARLPAHRPNEISGLFDCVVLAVKSDQTDAAAQRIASVLASDGFVVSFQNGLNELVIAGHLGSERTVGAFVNWSAEYMEPGTLWLGGLGALVLGELDGRITPRLDALLAICRLFNPDAQVSTDIAGYLWGKLIYGSFLRVTAVTDLSIVDGLNDATCREACIRLAREIIRVADRHGVSLQGFNGFAPDAFRPAASRDALSRTFEDMAAFNATSAITHASVWRDLSVRRRRTDTRAQFAPFVALADGYSIAIPTVRALIDAIERVEAGSASLGPSVLAGLVEGSIAAAV